ncbi:MAG TPA: porin family protein [Bacteroidia bacterium]|nr:porin family protein [Bacteroidia bacterium]
MKKLIFSAVTSLVLCTSGLVFSQSTSTPPASFYIGLKATPIVYWGTVDDNVLESDGARVGFTYGLMTDFHIDRSYFFSTGLDISSRGFKAKAGDIKIVQRLKYIDIPVALKLKTKEMGYMTYYGLFGFLPGFLIGANQDIESPAYSEKKRSNQSDFSFFNAGILVGLGVEYNIGGSTILTGGLTYNNSFTDAFEPKEGNDAKIKSNQISLNLGVFF